MPLLGSIGGSRRLGDSFWGLTKIKVEKRLSEARDNGRWIDVPEKTDWISSKIGWAPKILKLEPEPGKPLWFLAGQLPAPYAFDGYTAEVRFEAGSKAGEGGLSVDYANQRAVIIQPSEGVIFLGRRGSDREEWIKDGSGRCEAKDQYQITVLLEGGDYVVLLDGEEKFRVRDQIARLPRIGVSALGGPVTFDRLQLRKAE